MGSQIRTKPVISDLCMVLHIVDEKSECPNEEPIAQLASSYVESIGREMQNDFDLYQINQQSLQEDFDQLMLKLWTLQSSLGISEEKTAEVPTETTADDTANLSSPAMKRDTFTPQKHREFLYRFLHSIRKLS